MKGKHTPGPWQIDLGTPFTLGGDSRSVDALTPDGKLVVREVANLLFDTDEWPDGEGWLEDAANARLIAAAPDLLAALEKCELLLLNLHRQMLPGDVGYLVSENLARVNAAIAKAKGE